MAGGKIPKGCMYYIGSKNTLLRAGMEFPENIEHGDVYITPEYVYTFPPITVGAHGIDACNVNPIDKTQEKYGKPLDNMYGIPVEGLKGITIDETVKVIKPVVPEDLLLQDEKVDYSPAAGKKIPVGCLYYIGDENTLLVAGTEFPENVTHGDVYITPEYVYTFPPMLVGKHGIDACKMSIISKTQEKHSIPLDNLYGIPVE